MSYADIGIAHSVGKRFERDAKQIAELQKEVKKLKWELAQSKAHAVGLDAQVEALLDIHTNSPLLQRTDIPYSNPMDRGKCKTKLFLIYEKAFDAACRAMRIKDPKKLRID